MSLYKAKQAKLMHIYSGKAGEKFSTRRSFALFRSQSNMYGVCRSGEEDLLVLEEYERSNQGLGSAQAPYPLQIKRRKTIGKQESANEEAE